MTDRSPARQFVPLDLDPGGWGQIEPLFDALTRRPVESADDLRSWLCDLDELESVLSEDGARRYIEMTCHTDDLDAERRYLHLVEEIQPRCEPRWHALHSRYLASPHRARLDRRHLEVFDRHLQARVELYRPENVPLLAELKALDQRYDKLCGAMTVTFEGAERTLPQMGRFQEELDRERRRGAWEAVARRRLDDRDAIEAIFEQMLELRRQLGRNAGLPDFRAYAWRSRERFDYTPDDCASFHDAVERTVVPLRDRLDERRRQALGVPALRPWDLLVDRERRPPLRPFTTTDELCEGVEAILGRLSPDFEHEFRRLRERGALDLESRKGKAPGGYQYSLDEVREPFIFMNAAGLQRDVQTLLHESGHAMHAAASRDLSPRAYRHPPPEFCEVASMAMEQFGRPYLQRFYPPEDAARAGRKHLEAVVNLLTWIATIDAFQHWLYTNPEHDRAQRRLAWNATLARFFHKLDWIGWDAARDAMWHRQGHLFGSPFYYIEYGIALIGALQLWLQACRDEPSAIAGYRRALALGGSRPLPELFAAAGIVFDLSARALGPLVEAVARELDVA